MAENQSDQRDYFRIKDQLFLRWELARADELTDTEIDAELGNVNDRINSMINVGFGESPVLAEALGLLNRKIDLLVESRKNVHHTMQKVKVNLSGSGMGFAWDRPAPNDQIIDIILRLQPSNLEVSMRMHVLYCDPIIGEQNAGYWIRGKFLPGQDLGVEQIVRHVSFRQTQRLAARHEEPEDRDGSEEEWYEDDD
jgi:hypothetical protein